MYANAARVINRKGQIVVSKEEEPPMSKGDKELVARAQTGDQSASEELIRLYQKKAYAIAYNMCNGDSEEAKEIVQEPQTNGNCRNNIIGVAPGCTIDTQQEREDDQGNKYMDET